MSVILLSSWKQKMDLRKSNLGINIWKEKFCRWTFHPAFKTIQDKQKEIHDGSFHDCGKKTVGKQTNLSIKNYGISFSEVWLLSLENSLEKLKMISHYPLSILWKKQLLTRRQFQILFYKQAYFYSFDFLSYHKYVSNNSKIKPSVPRKWIFPEFSIGSVNYKEKLMLMVIMAKVKVTNNKIFNLKDKQGTFSWIKHVSFWTDIQS